QLMRPWHGAPWLHGGGVGVVYDTVGFPETVEVALRVAAPRASVVVTGVESPKRFEWTPLYFKEIEVVGSNAFGVEEFEGRRRHAMEICFDLVASGRIDVTPVITHRFTLNDYRRAFLSDAAYVDGRRPSAVHFGSAREDALRRDFTINALFLDPLTGEVVDFVGGQADLRARIIRAIGDPRARIAEDRLRMLRAARLAARL